MSFAFPYTTEEEVPRSIQANNLVIITTSFPLRINLHTVWTNRYGSPGIQSIPCPFKCLYVTAEKPFKIVTVNSGVTVQTQLPLSCGWHTNIVALFRSAAEVEHNDHIVTGSMLIPTLESNDIVGIIYMENINKLTTQATAVPFCIQP